MASPLLEHSDRLNFFEVVQGLELGALAEKHPAFDEVRQEGIQLVSHVSGGRNSENVVELFECPLFCFCGG